MSKISGHEFTQSNRPEEAIPDSYDRLKQATFLPTRTPTGSKSRCYRWRMIVSAVLVLNQQRQSISFHVRNFKREGLTPSFAIYNDAVKE